MKAVLPALAVLSALSLSPASAAIYDFELVGSRQASFQITPCNTCVRERFRVWQSGLL